MTFVQKKAYLVFVATRGIHVSQTQIRNRIRGHLVFSTPEPKAQVHYCDQALSVRPSVVVNFSHFQLLLWNHWTEFNEIWQEAKSQSPPPGLCFLGRSEKQDSRSGLWLAETFSTPPLKPLNGIQRNLTGSKISTSSTKFVFFGQIGKNKMAALASGWLSHFLLLLWNRWMEFNQTLSNGIQRNLTGSKISLSSTKFLFFGPIGKASWPPWPLMGWIMFDFSSETAERNSTKLDRKQDINVLRVQNTV